jgi:hypothetical protein
MLAENPGIDEDPVVREGVVVTDVRMRIAVEDTCFASQVKTYRKKRRYLSPGVMEELLYVQSHLRWCGIRR